MKNIAPNRAAGCIGAMTNAVPIWLNTGQCHEDPDEDHPVGANPAREQGSPGKCALFSMPCVRMCHCRGCAAYAACRSRGGPLLHRFAGDGLCGSVQRLASISRTTCSHRRALAGCHVLTKTLRL
jgi:hypothetical protein